MGIPRYEIIPDENTCLFTFISEGKKGSIEKVVLYEEMETEGYDNVTRVFRGFSNGRVVVETSDKLPQGTYYYVIEYVDENKQKRSEVGWLYLKR